MYYLFLALSAKVLVLGVRDFLREEEAWLEDFRGCSRGYCSSNEVENEIHLVLHCNLHERIRKTFFNDIISKYPEFDTLSEQSKTFLFNNIDPCICKKLGYFIFEDFQKRKQRS